MKQLLLVVCLGAGANAFSAEIIAELIPGADPSRVGRPYGLQLLDATDGGPFALYQVPPGVDPEQLEITFRKNPSVVWAEENDDMEMPEHSGGGKATVIGAVGDPNAFYQMNAGFLTQVSWLPPASASPIREVNVAVLDTGLSPQQPFLWKRVIDVANFVEVGQPPYDLPMNQNSNGNEFSDEAIGHGTMVTGVIAQMAPHAGLIPVRIADSDGTTTSWRMIKGLVFAVHAGADIINVSLGSMDRITALSDMLDWVELRNVLVVAAAGNNARETDFYPASYSEVISVVALDQHDRKAPFSNWEGSVDMCAPGTGIRSFFWDGTMAFWSGTSFSSPIVAAGVAIALEYAKRLYTVEELQDLIESTGTNIDHLNPQYADGIGMKLHILRLVQAIRGTP
jgi:subtilisin family serine protease